MQTYFLAANLFALTALLLGLNDFSKGRHSWRLVPLFLLVISRSLSLIVFLKYPTHSQSTLTTSGFAALEIFSAFCLVWVLINPMGNLPLLWQRLAWLGGGVGLLFSLLPLSPDWPVPPQLHSLTIAVFGAPLILVSLGQISWVHLAAPVILAIANFLSLLELNNVSGLLILLAYGFLIGALHWESLQTYRGRQKASEALAQKAIDLSRERQRLLEVSEIISAAPSLSGSMEHLARSMAHITHSDQAAIFMLDVETPDQIHTAAIYAPERGMTFDEDVETPFKLATCAPLQAVIEQQNQRLLYPHLNGDELQSLYALWDEYRWGPALIQPLTVQGRSIGALVLGNPVTGQTIEEDDQALCQSLASQIAIMVEAYRRYFDLEWRAEAKTPPRSEAKSSAMATPEPSLVATPPDIMAGESSYEALSSTSVRQQSPPLGLAEAPAVETSAPPATLDSEIGGQDYLSIIEAVYEGIVVSDVSGRVQLVNKAAERILGKSRREIIGQPIGTIYGEIASGESIEELAQAFSRRNEPLPTFVEADERAIQGHLIPWRNAEWEWLGIIAVFRDVTPQFKADRARNDFIAALSRVLRGPLTLIKGYAELITDGTMGDYSPEQLHVQRIIHSSAERVVQVLDNAIQISAQNKRKTLPRFEEVNITEVIDEILGEIAPMAQLRELELRREIKSELPPITADRKHLHIILKNLLHNACRFTPAGGHVTLQAWIQQEREGNVRRPYLQLAVADNGVGIPQIEHKRIFDPFYRLDNERPDDENGMGMGLSVVKELVELHNGRVWVESMLGAGSVFQVVLPVRQE